jgi:conjugative relaxase-like TrwC/TraI family protein
MVSSPKTRFEDSEMLTIRAMSNGSGYSARHLQYSDYYSEDERITGQWQGRGAQLLGLSGEVRTEQFEALRQGLHPETGEFLRPRQSADRFSADGTSQSHGRNLYDFTISAPKSVSIMAELGHDERLVEAHRTAVQETLKELEDHAGTRVRLEGANHNRCTGNLVLAVYHHDTSRELDPQLHTHAVAANLTHDGAEGRWKAVQASEIYERRAYLTEVYRNALAREVCSLGYEIENRSGVNGKDLGFEIKGVSHQILEKYSQRSEQRDQAINEFVKANNRPPTDNEVAILVRESRADKLIEVSSAEVHSRQCARLSQEERLVLEQIREGAATRCQIHQRDMSHPAPSLDYAERHVFERVSVAVEHQVLAEALRHGRGQIDLGNLRGELSLQETRGEVLRAGQEIATRESLSREREMIGRVRRGAGQFERLGGEGDFAVSDSLRPEQRKAVEFVLGSRDLAVNLRGAAGTGKTAALLEIHRGLRDGGREVVAVAPTMSAVEELQRVGLSDAITVEHFLQDRGNHGELNGKAIIVDEAGMVSGRQMAELLKVVEQQSARIVFSGDTKQIRSVEACDALRILEKESELRSISLTGVQRQTGESYRGAIEHLRRDPERGFERLEAMGAIREVPWKERSSAVEQAYFEAKSEPNAKGHPRSVLVVASTHEDIRQITAAIRAALTRRCEIGESVRLEHHVPLNWTRAQKGDIGNYRDGQVLIFHRAVGGIVKNEALRVQGTEGGEVIAKNAHGEEQQVSLRHAGCFSVYELRDIEVAPNDRLLLMSNRRDGNFRATNGELATVSRIDEQHRIHLQDGRILPDNYKYFTHGYAVTAHRSQGKSVDGVVISGDGMRKELFYVAASRGREAISVVTSNRELFRETIAHSDIRQSASDLALKGQPRPVEPPQHLRETYWSRAVALESATSGTIHQLGESKEPSVSEACWTSDDNHGRQPEHQQALEPSHSFGMSH